MPQDAFTLRLIAKELNTALTGGRVNKINQPDREELSLLLYTGKRTVKLVFCANASNCGVYFSEDDRENPLVAPGFCMLLRKHLQGAELLGVETLGFERVLLFRFRCVSDFSSCERILYAEIMGKYSNLLLTESGVILGALKMTSLDMSAKRMIFAGAKYTPPVPQDKVNPSDYAALASVLQEASGDLINFLFTRVAGLAPCTAEQIVAAYQGGDFAKHVYDYIFSDDISPRVTEQGENVIDFLARGDSGIPFDTLSAAQQYFYARKRAKKHTDGARRKLLSVIGSATKKAEKRLSNILEKRIACKDAEENRIKGELITANLWALSRGMKKCELVNYYDEAGRTMQIALDAQLSPSENAQAYYKKYRKQKRTLEILAPQESETRAELDYYKSLLSAAQTAENAEDFASLQEELIAAGLLAAPKERTKKAKPEIPFRTYAYAGYTIYAGRNNVQNDKLVRSSADGDIWLHAQGRHSCHVVVKANGKSVPEPVLQFAANICAKYSEGGNDKIPVDYCLTKYVKKPKGAKAGFVTYTDFKTLLGDPSSRQTPL